MASELCLGRHRLGLLEGVETFDEVVHRMFTEDLVVTSTHIYGAV